MKKIRNLLLLLLVCTTTITLTGCGEKNVEGKLDEIMEKVYSDVNKDNGPSLVTENILAPIEGETEEDLKARIEYTIGTTEIDYKEIYETKPVIGSIAYSVVLVRMEDNADIEAAKTKILDTVDPRKWFCVGVEKEDVIVKSKGNLIILIMVEDKTMREEIEEGFDNL